MNNPPLILASKSRARVEMLQNASLDFTSQPADIDETAIIESLSRLESLASPQEIALQLAQQKAQHISTQNPDALVIGSDQILEHNGQIFEKAEGKDAARDRLKNLRGKTHRLISAVAIVKNNKTLWSTQSEATLSMHHFDDAFLEDYLERAGDDITSCVGGYALERLGSWLFSDIKGDIFTILGMPLLPLLDYLKTTQNFKP